MSNPGQSDRERQLAEHLKRSYENPEFLAVANRHMLWRETIAGHVTMAKLNSLAILRVQGLVTQHDYEAAVHELATENIMPLADMRILAEGAYKFAALLLSGCRTDPGRVGGLVSRRGGRLWQLALQLAPAALPLSMSAMALHCAQSR